MRSFSWSHSPKTYIKMIFTIKRFSKKDEKYVYKPRNKKEAEEMQHWENYKKFVDNYNDSRKKGKFVHSDPDKIMLKGAIRHRNTVLTGNPKKHIELTPELVDHIVRYHTKKSKNIPGYEGKEEYFVY